MFMTTPIEGIFNRHSTYRIKLTRQNIGEILLPTSLRCITGIVCYNPKSVRALCTDAASINMSVGA